LRVVSQKQQMQIFTTITVPRFQSGRMFAKRFRSRKWICDCNQASHWIQRNILNKALFISWNKIWYSLNKQTNKQENKYWNNTYESYSFPHYNQTKLSQRWKLKGICYFRSTQDKFI